MNLPQSRSLMASLVEDLERKMVFLGGPRQVGKTTLAKQILARFPGQGLYLNWDNRTNRKRMLNEEWPPETRCLVLNEFHKQPNWKSRVKGMYVICLNSVGFLSHSSPERSAP
jgi:uncharacterized protein